MATNIESLFSVRETPWHGLGTAVSEAPTSADAIKLAELDWEVHSKPIYDMFGQQINGFVANTRDRDNSILGIVSDKYQIVQNAEAFEFTDTLLENGDIRYETAGSLRKGKQIWLLAKMPQQQILDDAVEPYICFTNTHDGTGAIRVCLTPIRVVCQNTLNLALRKAKRSWSTKHMGVMASKLNEAKLTLGMADKYMHELNNSAEQLVERKLYEEELNQIINELFPIDTEKDSVRKVNNMMQLRNEFYRCYEMPDIKQFQNTAWGAVNAMSDMVGHMTPARKTATYKENRWGKIMNGHPLMDALLTKINVAA